MTEAIILALIGMFGMVFASNGLWAFIQSKSSKKSPYEQMVFALGKERLLRLSKKYIKMTYIPIDEFSTFVVLGEAYFAMKGNSTVKLLYEQALELPRK